MNFTSVTCHVTLGSNVTKLHSALERKPCTSYQTYFSFLSLAHAHEETYGWLARLVQTKADFQIKTLRGSTSYAIEMECN